MTYVNDIAAIVHETVDYFTGAANKNIGDSFLVVWKFPENFYIEDPDTKQMTVNKEPITQQRADMALISFLKILSSVKACRAFDKIKQNEALNAKIPNFYVNLGFGLHLGWAVEGAIGSDFKIDASYLSPHVNMAG